MEWHEIINYNITNRKGNLQEPLFESAEVYMSIVLFIYMCLLNPFNTTSQIYLYAYIPIIYCINAYAMFLFVYFYFSQIFHLDMNLNIQYSILYRMLIY